VLLSAEVKGETELLEQEKTDLETLEKELADQEGAKGKQAKGLHPFARNRGAENPRPMVGEYESGATNKLPAAALSELENDAEAKDLVEHLQNYLDSIQTDVEGTRHIREALTSSQAALDVFNWRQLGKTEYRHVYGVDAT
jgi:kinetochore protein Fta7